MFVALLLRRDQHFDSEPVNGALLERELLPQLRELRARVDYAALLSAWSISPS